MLLEAVCMEIYNEIFLSLSDFFLFKNLILYQALCKVHFYPLPHLIIISTIL